MSATDKIDFSVYGGKGGHSTMDNIRDRLRPRLREVARKQPKNISKKSARVVMSELQAEVNELKSELAAMKTGLARLSISSRQMFEILAIKVN